jgi:hypothetical protein
VAALFITFGLFITYRFNPLCPGNHLLKIKGSKSKIKGSASFIVHLMAQFTRSD